MIKGFPNIQAFSPKRSKDILLSVIILKLYTNVEYDDFSTLQSSELKENCLIQNKTKLPENNDLISISD